MSAEEALRRYNANRQLVQQRPVDVPREAVGVAAEGIMALNVNDPLAVLRAKLERLRLETPQIEIPLANRGLYKDVPDLRELLDEEKKDFRDDEYLEEEGFYIDKSDLDFLAKFGRVVMPMLSHGFNTHGIVGLFILAYNLRVPNTVGQGMVFEDINPDHAFYDAAGETVPNVQHSGRAPPAAYEPTIDPAKEAMFYCYIAASTLRLFSKSVENYVHAWDNIVNKFSSFYGFVPPRAIMPPTIQSLTGLHGAFSADSRMRMTLYKILYHAKRDQSLDGLRRFLYEMHLTNTGVHAVGIFANLVSILNMESGYILKTMHTAMFERQFEALKRMTRMATSTEPHYAKKMWRFGRIFDHNFMSSLQTKACLKFVYILASMLKQEDPAKCQNITQIVHFNHLTEDAKMRCETVAKALLKQIREGQPQVPPTEM